MSFRNMGQDQTVPGGICIRSCQAGKFPHKVNSLGAVLASLHTHIPWQMQGRSFTPPYLLHKWLLEEGNEWVGPWNVNVDLEKKVGYTHQLCFPGAQ